MALPSRSTGAFHAGPLAVIAFWLAVMGIVYLLMDRYLQREPVAVSANGELVIPRARDGHFYVKGLVNGTPVTFLVDSGASMVVVSEQTARTARLAEGRPTTFRTANGEMEGRIVPGVSVAVQSFGVTGLRVGVGLVGLAQNEALLGQNFLSRFDVLLSADRMVLRPRGAPGASAG